MHVKSLSISSFILINIVACSKRIFLTAIVLTNKESTYVVKESDQNFKWIEKRNPFTFVSRHSHVFQPQDIPKFQQNHFVFFPRLSLSQVSSHTHGLSPSTITCVIQQYISISIKKWRLFRYLMAFLKFASIVCLIQLECPRGRLNWDKSIKFLDLIKRIV